MRYARRGFTLLELMIAIALMLVVMLMLRSMFVNAQEIYIRAARRVDVFAQGRAVLDSIERDLMKLVKGHDNETLTLRSLTPANWTNAELARQGDTYSSLEDWDITDPNQSARIQEFMSFRGVFRMWDAEQQKSVDRNASVIYYLRRRRNVSGTEEGAYLVRRLVPYYTNRELVAFGKKQDQAPQLKVDEDELASFVYSKAQSGLPRTLSSPGLPHSRTPAAACLGLLSPSRPAR
jgi:prepilin-type N-terminal cleavage/methylation domain-containing protein